MSVEKGKVYWGQRCEQETGTLQERGRKGKGGREGKRERARERSGGGTVFPSKPKSNDLSLNAERTVEGHTKLTAAFRNHFLLLKETCWPMKQHSKTSPFYLLWASVLTGQIVVSLLPPSYQPAVTLPTSWAICGSIIPLPEDVNCVMNE